jgi:hypothetical protein
MHRGSFGGHCGISDQEVTDSRGLKRKLRALILSPRLGAFGDRAARSTL